MSKPSSYTIHITYSASSNKKPSSHQGQGKSVLSSVLYNELWCISTSSCLVDKQVCIQPKTHFQDIIFNNKKGYCFFNISHKCESQNFWKMMK